MRGRLIARASATALLLTLPGSADEAGAAELTARQITLQLFQASAASPVDFSGKNLQGLDLSGLDFKRARLSGSDLFGADLAGADLTGADLSAARLDRIVIIGARFDGANLAGASLLRPTTFSTLEARASEAPSFVACDLTGAKLFGRLNGVNLARANLEGASLAPFGRTGFIEHLWRTELVGADLSEANLAGADLTHVSFRFASLRGANLRGARFRKADLSHADLTGADLSHADLLEADLDGAILRDVKGLDTVAGLDHALNRAKAIE
ncbi:MAG TPA: pentapeptide repeat-containing protein [Hyphomicrobiaceae bacterium]|nr:pentapeptide repeat-containing protein [Hyphomicrobiaceae bacterium]